MIQDVPYIELTRSGEAKLLQTEIDQAKAYGLRINKGHLLVRNGDALPLIDGKTCTKDFGETAAYKYNLSEPLREIGALSSMVVIPGARNYYHFLIYNLPAFVFLRWAPGDRATLGIVQGIPDATASVVRNLLPLLAGDRQVDMITVAPGDYAVENVVVRAVPMMRFSIAFGRTVQRAVLRSLGYDDPLQMFGPLKLFVRRAGTRNGRELSNQPEIEAWLVARSYTSVDPGQLSIEEQIVLFSRATHIVGVEGAALANLVFAKNAKQVVILASPVTWLEQFFWELANCAGLPLMTLYGDVAPEDATTRRANFVMPMAKLQNLDV